MWIVRLALRRPYTVATLCLLIFLMSGLALARMKTDILPAIDIPVVIVVWNYPGLSAEEMETRVVFINERAFSTTVGGISRIESQSISGIGIVKVYFEPGADIGGAIAQVAAVCNTILRVLPPGIQPPTVLRFNASNLPVAQLTISGKNVSEQQLYDYGLNFLRLRLFTIPGLSTPAPYGGRSRQIMVDLDPAKAAAKGLSPQDVVQAVTQSNVILPAGSARIGNTEYDVQLNASPERLADFNNIPIKIVNGAQVLLKDVAYVHDGYAIQNNIVHVNGSRATYLAILRKADASTLTVVESTRALLPSIKATAPEGVELKLDFDQSLFVRAAVSGVLREALIASILVSLMVLFFLGSWRSTLVVITSIPLAILVGVLGLFLAGETLNLMTLGGLSLAVGMLVDDATVEVENIHRNRLMNKGLTVAIMDGAQQIAVPALAATLTICIVFFPVVMLQGAARFLFTPLALAVVVSMLASYFLSRTLVPSLARKLLDKEAHHSHGDGYDDGKFDSSSMSRGARFNAWRDRHFEKFRDKYGNTLGQVLQRPGWVLLGFLLVFLCAAALLRVVGLDFFPSVDTGQMRLHFRAPVGTRIEETERQVLLVEQAIRRIIPPDELETINDNIGVPVSYNLAFVQSDNVGGQDADILIALKPHHHPTVEYMKRIRREMPEQFPSSTLYFQPADVVSQVLNFGVAAPIDIQIEGRDQAKSLEYARKLFKEVAKVPGTVDLRIAQVFNHPALRVDVDRQKAALFNLSERDVANSLLTSLASSSLVAPSFWINPANSVNYPVVVQTPLTKLGTVDALMQTPLSPASPLTGSTGGPPNPNVQNLSALTAPASSVSPYVGALSSLQTTEDKASINHYTVQGIVELQSGVEGRDLGAVSRDIQRVLQSTQKDLPKNSKITIRGQSESMFTSFGSLGQGMLVAIALVYLLLVVLFQSWVDPFIIMVAVPGAMIGISWMLAITGTTLNVESFMGAIMAVGIATSNSILLVSFANEARAEDESLSALDAAILAGKTRLRPVLMTALAMILGMLPMALALGEGGEQNAPLGRAVIGGLLMATFVTLFFVPLAYSVLRKKPPTAHRLDEQFEREYRPHGAEKTVVSNTELRDF